MPNHRRARISDNNIFRFDYRDKKPFFANVDGVFERVQMKGVDLAEVERRKGNKWKVLVRFTPSASQKQVITSGRGIITVTSEQIKPAWH